MAEPSRTTNTRSPSAEGAPHRRRRRRGPAWACRYVDLPRINDPRGNLTFVQQGIISFEIQRVYYLYDVPAGAERGGHAHKTLHQLIIPMAGSFDVILDNGSDWRSYRLDRPYRGLYIAPMVWRELNNFASGSVCLVLASAPFAESDYIREYPEFVSAAREAS